MAPIEHDESTKREIRIALVLYGGVSLAIYENGVARAFYELFRGRGVFKPLLALLDAYVSIDVIAGTSAGGINGLILAACLESGKDFAPTANIWRRLGDLGDLLRNVGASATAASLLDGEGYYQRQLLEAFQDLCTPEPNGPRTTGEMDVFITGTDVDGHARRYVDGLGRAVTDKEHRVVFQLQHRSGRKSLGVPAGKDSVDPKQQGAILAAIARITSSFPVAFPPFRASDLGAEYADGVAKALAETSGVSSAGKTTFVDGGVLDNKPFGPALKAIFHRMPGGPVDRRLFYVEPDPVPFSESHPEHTPAGIGVSSLTTIPSYESIAADLDELKKHNQRIDWLQSVKETIQKSAKGAPRGTYPAYVTTRIDAAARALVLDGDDAPSAAAVPEDPECAALLACVVQELTGRIGDDLASLDPWDVHFQLRRAFHLLYEYYGAVSGGSATSDTATAMRLIGRVIKALKLIRDYMAELRDRHVAAVTADAAGAKALLTTFTSFLAAEAPQWRPLVACLSAGCDLRAAAGKEREVISSGMLSEVARGARAALDAPASAAPAQSVLDHLARTLREIVCACDGGGNRFDEFEAIDAHLYPLEFASGIYELDRIEFVRISPADAQTGLSAGLARDKVAGDELAHFAAFLRRDWRTNDILYGRLDGICQIVWALLDEPALERALARTDELEPLFGATAVREWLPDCPEAHCRLVADAWKALRETWRRDRAWSGDAKGCARQFREAIILAGQEQAVAEDLAKVFADVHYQEIAYGYTKGPRGVGSAAQAGLIERDAEQAAEADVARLAPEERSRAFRDLRLGSQDIAGPKGHVPHSIIGEYVTQAYLLVWDMMQRSLGPRSSQMLKGRQTRLVFRGGPRFVYASMVLMRRERSLASALLLAGAGVGLGGLIAWWFTLPANQWLPHNLAECRIPAAAVGVLIAVGLLALFLTRKRARPQWTIGKPPPANSGERPNLASVPRGNGALATIPLVREPSSPDLPREVAALSLRERERVRGS